MKDEHARVQSPFINARSVHTRSPSTIDQQRSVPAEPLTKLDSGDRAGSVGIHCREPVPKPTHTPSTISQSLQSHNTHWGSEPGGAPRLPPGAEKPPAYACTIVLAVSLNLNDKALWTWNALGHRRRMGGRGAGARRSRRLLEVRRNRLVAAGLGGRHILLRRIPER